jgi:chitin disaccharide deacetylase
MQVLLCADDYALHPAVDEAVVALARQGRLSATSCMTTSPRWADAARLLQAVPALARGLHLNMTEGHGQAAPTLNAVLLGAYARRLSPARVRTQVRQQLDDFEQALGGPPDFIDGHQHVHQLPGVREVLLAELAMRYGAAAPSVRATVPATWRWGVGKAGVLALLGGWRFRRQLAAQGLPHNPGFAGVYGFDAATPAEYGRHMDRWLAGSRDGTLMMCHPANALVTGDAIAAARVVEFQYLASDAFAESLRKHGVAVGAFPRRATPG